MSARRRSGRERHLTHAVTHARSVEIASENGRRDHTLIVEDARGHAVLTFVD